MGGLIEVQLFYSAHTTQSVYTYLSNKEVALNKRVGWKITLPAVLASRMEFSIYYISGMLEKVLTWYPQSISAQVKQS